MRADARHLARERALEILYEAAVKQIAPDEVLAELPVAADPFVDMLVRDAAASRAVAEAAMAAAATDWSLDRMALLDRLVMVLAVGEVLGADPPPDAVVLDEAVELAKTYSTDASPRFVNGVLAAVLATLPREQGEAPAPDAAGDAPAGT